MIDLVLISGPIASGKTSLALRLAEFARRRGETAAAIDMDELVEMVGGSHWSAIGQEHRSLACKVAAAIVERLMATGIGLISLAGSTVHGWEWDQLLGALNGEPRVLSVRLRVSLAESIRRAQADSSRVSTLNADFVTSIYSCVDWASLPEQDLDLATDGLSLDEVARVVADQVFGSL